VIIPLVKLTDAATKMGDHSEKLELDIEAQDEIGMLYQSLNDMVEKLKESYGNLKKMAMHDPLTNLPNRKSVEEKFSEAKQVAERTGKLITVMFADLDRFKNINDTLGHHVGDTILKEVSERFSSVIRKEDMVARLGGDEFMILLTDADTEKDISKVANKLLSSLEKPFLIDHHTLHIATSLGIAVFPHDGKDIYSLLKNSDIALYRAKEAGRNRFQFYDFEMNVESFKKLSLENDLRKALSNNEIFYHYQPIVDRIGKVISVESLIRWQHPKLGMMPPDTFIGLAEEIGVIDSLGEYGLEQACEHLSEWKKLFPDNVPKIALNFSNRHFSEFDFIERVSSILANRDCDPYNIEIEITEGTAMGNIDRSSSKFQDLKRLGFSISIDDFGTGYSSLSYLKTFPINRLKIDRSFVRYCTSDEQDASIITAIITMAHSMSIEVVAEGVETKEQYELLYGLGCDSFQGYLISRPLTFDKFNEWSRKNNLMPNSFLN
jgi:diguanylate cyclase (GGDEF)-like protein